MKTQIHIQSFLSIMVVGVLLSTATLSQHPARVDFRSNEPLIDLQKFIRPYDELKPKKSDFRKFFGITQGNTQARKQGDTISASALVTQLYQVANDAMVNDPLCAGKKCISALRIIYGSHGRDIEFLYQPLYLVQKHLNIDSIFVVADLSSTSLYRYDDSTTPHSFVQVTNPPSYPIHYKRNIKIKRKPADPGHDLHGPGDPVSIIFSFQEILEFYKLVYSSETGPYYVDSLAIHSASAKDSSTPPQNSATHTLFMTRADWSKLLQEDISKMKVLSTGPGANLAHLCPPSCTELTYPIIP